MEWFSCKVDDRSKVVGGAQRIETPDGYVFLLSLESGLVYMHSIWVPTDDDLQQYPHVFFTSPDIRDASVLDHGITPALLEEVQPEADYSLLKDSMFDQFGDCHQRVVHHWDIFWDSSLQRLGSTLFILIFIRAILLRKIGSHSGHILDGNLNKLSKTVTRLLPGTVPQHDYLKKHVKSWNHVFNISRRNEPVAKDTNRNLAITRFLGLVTVISATKCN